MRHFTYKVLIVDNDHHETSKRLPESRKVLETKVIRTIEGALEALDSCLPSYMNKNVVDYRGEPKHDYDIVLLDFEMDENKLREDKQGFVSFEFPLGAVSLQPIFLLGFRRSGKLGSCIVQTYSKVMWDRCPKAAAVTHIVHNLLSNQPLRVIHDGDAGNVDLAGLVKARAESIVDALPFNAIGELKLLLDENSNGMINRDLPNVAAQLQVDTVTLGDLRPDSVDQAALREWLECILRNKGFAYEAYRAFRNECIDDVSHAYSYHELTTRNIFPLEPTKWIDATDATIVTVRPGNKYYVCPEIVEDLRNFDIALMTNGHDRAVALHRIFRMWLSARDVPDHGYMLREALASDDGSLFMPQFAGSLRDGNAAIYVHRRCLAQMFVALSAMVTGAGLGDRSHPSLVVFADTTQPAYKGCAYFVVPQTRSILLSDAEDIQKGLRTQGKWNDFGNLLEAWGSLELWSTPLSYAVSKYTMKQINERQTPYLNAELLQAITGSRSALVLVLPRR